MEKVWGERSVFFGHAKFGMSVRHPYVHVYKAQVWSLMERSGLEIYIYVGVS